jgi:hypothetical protein
MIELRNSKLIFSTIGRTWRGNQMLFAQSPQTLVLENKLRVYFSTRSSDTDGQYLSHVTYAEFDENFSEVHSPNHEVIELGKLGTFDEHGIFPLHIYSEPGRILGYIGGWSRKSSVSVDGAIGLSVSNDDGMTFSRVGDGPIIDASIEEPFLIGDPFVLRIKNVFHMWYIRGSKWLEDPDSLRKERIYKIAHATSSDGISWTKDKEGIQVVGDKLGQNEAQAMPSVIKIDETYYLFYCYRDVFDFRTNSSKGYRLGCVRSKNLQDWEHEEISIARPANIENWDAEMMCYPHVFSWRNRNFIAYNGNNFGREGFGVAEISVTPKDQ